MNYESALQAIVDELAASSGLERRIVATAVRRVVRMLVQLTGRQKPSLQHVEYWTKIELTWEIRQARQDTTQAGAA